MTFNGAIKQLHELQNAEDMPFYYKPIITEVINVLLMDAQEITYGHWLPYEYGDETWHKCSKCGTADQYGYKYTAFDGKEYTSYSMRSYCPNCGAKMYVE